MLVKGLTNGKCAGKNPGPASLTLQHSESGLALPSGRSCLEFSSATSHVASGQAMAAI
jgi:hypothetical protein